MTKSLYERLGGRAGIGAIAAKAVLNHTKNPAVRVRFAQSDIAKVTETATLFFCAGSGGPEAYPGKDMRTAHRGMNINATEYLAVMDDIVGAMNDCKVGPQEQADVIAILYSLKGEILHV